MKRIWVLLGLAAVLAGAIFVVVRLTSQSDQGIANLPEEPASRISIMSPSFGQQFDLGSPVVVDAFAYAADPVTAIELWIDGQLLGLQEAPEDGVSPYTTSFQWGPQNAGLHTLITRVFTAEGPLGISPAVNVLILESESGGVANDHEGMSVPVVLPVADGGGAVQPPDPSDSIQPAVQMDGKPVFDDAPALPTAPQLSAEVEGCSVELNYHDLADDEVGFRVYRQGSNTITPVNVATLEPSVGQGWLSYSDMAYPGGFTYFVATFNSQGESPSNPVVVNVSSADCDQPESGQQALDLDLGGLLADSGADSAYCYQSLDGAHWARVPQEGFFIPGEQNQESFITIGQLVGENAVEPLTLTLECWGWIGEVLELLGTFQHEFELGELDNIEPQINQSIFGGNLELVAMDGSFGFYATDEGGDIGWNPFDWFKNLLVHDPTMPVFNAYITYDPDVCKSHLMPDAQNWFGQLLFCTPFPGFDTGEEGGNPQPYLVWDESGKCGAGSGNPPCVPYPSWESLADDVGGNVWFTITDSSNAGYFSHIVDAPYLHNLTIPPVACTGARTFHVSMYYSDNSNIYFSLPYQVVGIDCPQPLPGEIPLDITFNHLTFWSLDDGDDGPDDVEVYGYMHAAVPHGDSVYLNLAEWDEQGDDCPDETFSGILDTSGGLIPGCTQRFENGTYMLADEFLCHGTSKSNCSYLGWGFEHNTIRVHVTDWDHVQISVNIWDWDDASGNDLQCQDSITIPARDRFDWAQVQDLPFHMQMSDNGNGECAIDGYINAAVP